MRTKPLPALAGGVVLGAVVGVVMRAVTEAQPSEKPATRSYHADKPTGLSGAAALLAASVLADSALEHYRGSFENPAMVAPLISSALTLGSSAGRIFSLSRTRPSRQKAFVLSIAVGAAGLGFHIYNVFKRPGGLSWLNLFYGAPVGAPAALSISGWLGLAAERLAAQAAPAPRFFGLPAGRVLAAFTSLALIGDVAEVALFHFRGAFQNPFMYAPLALPPIAAGLLAKAAVAPIAKTHLLTRAWLWTTFLLGMAGTGFHAYGVSRAMGGWRNWSQNLIDGPPLPAPPSFSALSVAGLAALSLIEREAHAGDRQGR
ncbi:hypothetical protein [Methylocystis echinoides]|uniref:hypothetical protein n=1 Tax=Methylocystis echinoides TaxID=29468 RepID=UPI0024905D5D|nr:hypothetical protein [Methylocystis echinoides]